MKLNPYLSFDGNAKQAFTFYQQVFGGQLDLMTYGQSPMAAEMPAASHDRVMHANLAAGELLLMGADGNDNCPTSGDGTFVNIGTDSIEEAERVFASLAEGGEVRMPLEKTFWTERFGMVVDRFGKPWMVNCTCTPDQ
ncbi:VOC family protein [Pseudoxanthomonas dokdonensis]|uniref:3-demethylubiquinone-9 3-methyltransferase n=1 Tax=Pseudoxanthomonas dokdonensis TaxID=344882 RepID=A0A0R0CZQ3_9GAMM|nr:VOC family protein [Pseudoxanthomonas dokdonensis]KRG71678.1 3-demethylubiquinone-9 3-methyltransferase [Pseudoxanthomonas dokdonensis]